VSLKDKSILTIDEVMELLSVTRFTVHKWIKEGKLRAVRIGRELRVTKEYLEEFLESNTVDNTNKRKRNKSGQNYM
jgi:excisionase family DNA binding protein